MNKQTKLKLGIISFLLLGIFIEHSSYINEMELFIKE